jgi:hypothetical protein
VENQLTCRKRAVGFYCLSGRSLPCSLMCRPAAGRYRLLPDRQGGIPRADAEGYELHQGEPAPKALDEGTEKINKLLADHKKVSP